MAKPRTPHLITRKGYATSVRQQSCQRLCNAQRIVGANQIVSQHPTRQRRAQGSAIGKRRISSSCSLAMAGSRGRAPCVLLGV
uniref:Uncharacterized protein n=1 Tax=Siphoviridae sp. ctjdk2 TaxID=2825635 RepID=A0A8S5UL22_9CAUD|nr:MAG TPA: hypothetical protein [Siphoviridae sp. ctjdk2]